MTTEERLDSIQTEMNGPNGISQANAVWMFSEVSRLRELLWVKVLCGGCGRKYRYNRAEDPEGKIAGDEHDKTDYHRDGQRLPHFQPTEQENGK